MSFAVLLFLFSVSHNAMGQKVVVVKVGVESVSLPFIVTKTLDPNKLPSALWKRGGETVHHRVDKTDNFNKQSPLFKGRTQMKKDALQTGDLTLELSYPTLTDSGTYSCEAVEGIKEVEHTTVKLEVRGIKKTAYEGDKSVSLPFFMKPPLKLSVSVEWTRDGLKAGPLQNMNPDALQNGDLTLVLSSPQQSDSGTYSCVVKDGDTELGRTTVDLTVESKSSIIGIIIGVIFGLLGLSGVILSALAFKRKKETEEGFKDACLGVITCRKGPYDPTKSSDRD